jgi:hypothetical protein
LDYAERTAARLEELLREIAWGRAVGKDVLLVFGEEDDYFQYVSHFCPDGEQAASGGMCIQGGYTHIALPWRDELDAANAIVHELTHDCLAHLPLPLWLNEGVAVLLQKSLAPGARPPVMSGELAERHDAFWNEESILRFWAGTSFYEPGDANELSYSLAEVLVTLLTERGPAFCEFVRLAHRDDAGQTAALDVLKLDLGELAATFFGPGNWRPRRRAIVACWEQAGWNRADET